MDSHVTLDLSRIAQDLQVRKTYVEGVVQLLQEGNSIPFITRYRKERTGGLDEEAIREIARRAQAQQHLADRKQTILKSIQAQGKLTDELQRAILAAESPKRLEDLYLPYKPKKRSLANAAKEKGLEPLAVAIWNKDPAVQNLEEIWVTMLNPEKDLHAVDEVRTGVQHILAELLSEIADARMAARRVLWETGKLVAVKQENLPDGQGIEYKDYFQFTEAVRQIPAHRVLAINRGEKESAIKVKLEYDHDALQQAILTHLPISDHPHADFLQSCALDAISRLVQPSLEREIRRDLTDEAEEHAVQVFARNLRSLLLQPPIRGQRVLAIDPAFRTGCKIAALDECGNLLEHGVIFPHPILNKHPERKPGKRNEKRPRPPSPKPTAPAVAADAVAEVTPMEPALVPQQPLAESATPDAIQPPVPAETPESTDAEADAPPFQLTGTGLGLPASAEEQLATTVNEATAEAPSTPPADASTPAAVAEPDALETTPEPAAPPAASEPGAPAGPSQAEINAQRKTEAKAKLEEMIRKHQVTVIAIGNGTACRETEELVAELISEKLPELSYVIVNEAGASHYSASSVGREEFPDLDASVRGTVSIGRRLQDPLSELVKIDPQNIGVGLYQHDLSLKRLKESLDAVVESCVNHVGVDLNTASVSLLRHVSGLNQLSARSIVDHRKQHGPFQSRELLKQVSNVGEATFTQAAGFLKISDANPFDFTWVHPESYPIAERMLAHFGLTPPDILVPAKRDELRDKLNEANVEALAAEWQVGVPTFDDIARALLKPGRDPREELPPPIFKKGVLKLEDLAPGMELKGTVLNVVDFGAFVDVGLKDSGLVHISQLANRFIKSPYDIVAVGDVVACWVMSVDMDRRRVSLTMIKPGTVRKPHERAAASPGAEGSRERRPSHGRPPRQAHPPKPRTTSAMVATPESVARKKQAAAEAGQTDQAAAFTGHDGPPPRRQAPPPRRSYQAPRRERPAAKLTEEALQGDAPLRTFGELKALYEAKKKE